MTTLAKAFDSFDDWYEAVTKVPQLEHLFAAKVYGHGTCPIHGSYAASERCPRCGLHHHDWDLDTPAALYHLERFGSVR